MRPWQAGRSGKAGVTVCRDLAQLSIGSGMLGSGVLGSGVACGILVQPNASGLPQESVGASVRHPRMISVVALFKQ
eukprot:1156855-Alexandrium_andersonii.AAC.1